MACSYYCAEGVHVLRGIVQPRYTDAQVTQFWSLALGHWFLRWTDAREADLAAWVAQGGWASPVSATAPARLCLVWVRTPTHYLPYRMAVLAERLHAATTMLREGREVGAMED